IARLAALDGRRGRGRHAGAVIDRQVFGRQDDRCDIAGVADIADTRLDRGAAAVPGIADSVAILHAELDVLDERNPVLEVVGQVPLQLLFVVVRYLRTPGQGEVGAPLRRL